MQVEKSASVVLMTLLANFSEVFEFLTDTFAVADLPCTLRGLLNPVETKPSLVRSSSYFRILLSGAHFRFRSVEAMSRHF